MKVPVQPMVMRLGFSSPPQDTSTGGSGFSRVLPRQLCLLIRDTSFRLSLIHILEDGSSDYVHVLVCKEGNENEPKIKALRCV